MNLNMEIPSSVDSKQMDRGSMILLEFHLASLGFSDYKIEFEDLIKYYGKKAPFMLEGIADSVDLIGFSDTKAKEYMKRFAKDMKGKIPENWQSYQFAFSKYASNPKWYEAIPYVTAETAKTIGSGIVTHGRQVLKTLEMYNKFLPWLLLGGVGFFIYSMGSKVKRVIK